MTSADQDGPRGRLLAIASGKGGVGKTWLAVTLSHALTEAGRRVLLVDADLGLANVDVQLGLDPPRDLSDIFSGAAVRDVAVPHQAGFDILAGRSGSGTLAGLDPARLDTLIDALRQAAATDWPLVVLDLGAGLDQAVRRLAAAADTLLVVATEEPTSLTDAYAALKLHRLDRREGGADARVVVNQAADRAAGERTWRTIDRACRNFLGAGVPLAGIIRRDPRVPDAIRRQVPLLTRHPTTPAAQDVRRLAEALDTHAPAAALA